MPISERQKTATSIDEDSRGVCKYSNLICIIYNFIKALMQCNERLTFDMSQAITEGSFETRSIEKTLFFTPFDRRASPVIHQNATLDY